MKNDKKDTSNDKNARTNRRGIIAKINYKIKKMQTSIFHKGTSKIKWSYIFFIEYCWHLKELFEMLIISAINYYWVWNYQNNLDNYSLTQSNSLHRLTWID